MQSKQSSTVFEVCAEAASANTTLTLVTGDGRSTRTPEDLLSEAEWRAPGLANYGLHRGDRAGIVAGTNFDFIVGSFALLRAGVAVVLLPEPSRSMPVTTWKEIVHRFMDAAGAKVLLTGRPIPGLRHETVSVSDVRGRNGADLRPPDPGDSAFISFSSGTTGTPKGVDLSHGVTVRRMSPDNFPMEVVPGVDHYLSWFPLNYIGSFQGGVIWPMVRGMSTTIAHHSLFGPDLSRWLIEMSRSRATESGAPTFAFAGAARKLGEGLSEPVDLSNWKLAWVGGGTVDPQTLWRFTDATAEFGFDGRALTPTYASTEAGGIAVTPFMEGPTVDLVDNESLRANRAEPSSTVDDSTMFVAGGCFSERSGLKDLDVRIVSETGDDLSERQIGEVYVRSPMMMDGYLDPVVNASAFEDGWFKTGDLAYMTGEYLYPAGRIKDMIIVRGRNIYAEDVERAVMSDPQMVASAAVALPQASTEGLLVVAEFSPGKNPDPNRAKKDLRKSVWAEIGVSPKEVILVEPGSLPRTDVGKIRRHVVSRTFTEGGYR